MIMSPESTRIGGAIGTYPGLCGSCARARIITTRAGSSFYLCERSRLEPKYPRYPRLPVLHCNGYAPREDLLLAGK